MAEGEEDMLAAARQAGSLLFHGGQAFSGQGQALAGWQHEERMGTIPA